MKSSARFFELNVTRSRVKNISLTTCILHVKSASINLMHVHTVVFCDVDSGYFPTWGLDSGLSDFGNTPENARNDFLQRFAGNLDNLPTSRKSETNFVSLYEFKVTFSTFVKI